jgi:hypothetical protein
VPASTEEGVGLGERDGLGTNVVTFAPPAQLNSAACDANLAALNQGVQ